MVNVIVVDQFCNISLHWLNWHRVEDIMQFHFTCYISAGSKRRDVLSMVVLLLLILIVAPLSGNRQLGEEILSETRQGICQLPPCACRPLIRWCGGTTSFWSWWCSAMMRGEQLLLCSTCAFTLLQAIYMVTGISESAFTKMWEKLIFS